MTKLLTPTSDSAPHQQSHSAPHNTHLMVRLASMEQQLEDLTEMLDQRFLKHTLVSEKMKMLQLLHSKQRDIAQREMIQQNERMIRILERQKAEIQYTENAKRNNEQMRVIEQEKQKLKCKEIVVEFQKLKVQQLKKELQWKQTENERKDNLKMNKLKLKLEIEGLREKIRRQMGVVDDSSLSLEQSSLYLELNQYPHDKNLVPKQIQTTAEGRTSSRKSSKNVLSIQQIKQMSLVSPLGLVLDIKDSRKYPFSQPPSLVLDTELY